MWYVLAVLLALLILAVIIAGLYSLHLIVRDNFRQISESGSPEVAAFITLVTCASILFGIYSLGNAFLLVLQHIK